MTVGPEALGILTEIVPPLDLPWSGHKVVSRYALRNTAGELLEGWRVEWCYKKTKFGGDGGAQIWRDNETHHCHYCGFMTCGSVWVCPVCASRITEVRRSELWRAIETAKVLGYKPVMITFAIGHKRKHELEILLSILNKAITATFASAAGQRLRSKFDMVGKVGALEVTWGFTNGWHPHKHFIAFVAEDADTEELQAILSARFVSIVERMGGYATLERGVDVREGNCAVGDYVSKWGLDYELAKSPVKRAHDGGFSPFELLEKAHNGEAWAGELFVEYANCMKGKRQLFWSQGLRELLGLGLEVDDGTLAEDVTDQDRESLIVEFSASQVSQLNSLERRRKGIKGELLVIARLGKEDLIWEYLSYFGIQSDSNLQRAYVVSHRLGGWDNAVSDNLMFTESPGDLAALGKAIRKGKKRLQPTESEDSPQDTPERSQEELQAILSLERYQSISRRIIELYKEHDWDSLNSRLQSKIDQARNR